MYCVYAIVVAVLRLIDCSNGDWLHIAMGEHPPRWPTRAVDELMSESALFRNITRGGIKWRKDPVNPPRWMRRPFNISHLNATPCNSCFQKEYTISLHREEFVPRIDEPVVLWDDHAIDAHTCVARSAEHPDKRELPDLRVTRPYTRRTHQGARRQARQARQALKHFGFYGTVMQRPCEDKNGSGFRIWLGELSSWTSESEDGLHWRPPTRIVDAYRTPYTHAQMFPNLCVTHDTHHEPLGRLLLTHACGNRLNGESICLATSAIGDGVAWKPIQGSRLTGTSREDSSAFANSCGPACRMGGDSNNCIRWYEWKAEYRLVKRRHFSTGRRWRGIRGVSIARASAANLGEVRPLSFTKLGSWYLDRDGMFEWRKRMFYSLSVHDLPTLPQACGDRLSSLPKAAPPLQVGLATLLEWVDVPQHLHAGVVGDRVTPYLITSRDGGLTADLSAIYAGQPMVPHSARMPSRELPFDYGYIHPASDLLTIGNEHWLYYEGRPSEHRKRWSTRSTIAIASWPLHRVVALRRLPTCNMSSTPCGRMLTRTFVLPSDVLVLNARVVDSSYDSSCTGCSPRPASKASVVLVEMLPSMGDASERAFPDLTATNMVPLRGNSLSQRVCWRGTGAQKNLRRLVGSRVKLLFWLCGTARLFSFTFLKQADSCIE